MCSLMMSTTHNLTNLNLNHGNEEKNLNLLEMPIGSKWTQEQNLANPNVDVDSVSKYVSVNQLSIARVNDLFWERISLDVDS